MADSIISFGRLVGLVRRISSYQHTAIVLHCGILLLRVLMRVDVQQSGQTNIGSSLDQKHSVELSMQTPASQMVEDTCRLATVNSGLNQQHRYCACWGARICLQNFLIFMPDFTARLISLHL